MNYGQVKTNFQAILNRRDITPTLVETFVSFGIQRAQRMLDVPSMEQLVAYPVDSEYTNGFDVPPDYLKMIAISTLDDTNNPVELKRADLTTTLRLSLAEGYPRVYARSANRIIIGPKPPGGTILYLNYLANFSELVFDDDSNWLTDAGPDLIIYGALSRAADYFLDERKQLFEDTFLTSIAEVNAQTDEDDITNATISPAYSLDDGGSY